MSSIRTQQKSTALPFHCVALWDIEHVRRYINVWRRPKCNLVSWCKIRTCLFLTNSSRTDADSHSPVRSWVCIMNFDISPYFSVSTIVYNRLLQLTSGMLTSASLLFSMICSSRSFWSWSLRITCFTSSMLHTVHLDYCNNRRLYHWRDAMMTTAVDWICRNVVTDLR